MKLKSIILILIIIIILPINLQAAEIENYFIQTSLFTNHYHDGTYQNNNQNLLGMERHYKNNRIDGLAFFKNTYSQNTWYIYWGKNYLVRKFNSFSITAKFTYGIVHGYDDENGKYNTWMHDMETFPGIVFSLGLKKGPFRIDMIPFADAGIIITGGVEF